MRLLFVVCCLGLIVYGFYKSWKRLKAGKPESKPHVEPSPLSRRARNAYIVANGVAILITLLAGIVNLVVGPRNPLIFLVIPFQLIFASLNFAAAEYLCRQQGESFPRFGPFWPFSNVKPLSPAEIVRHFQTTRTISLIFTPVFFLVFSIALFYEAVKGTIDPIGSM